MTLRLAMAMLMVSKGGTTPAAADCTGLSQWTVHKYARRLGLIQRGKGRIRGSVNKEPCFRVQRIIRLHRDGLCASVIAERLGCTNSNVRLALLRWLPRMEALESPARAA